MAAPALSAQAALSGVVRHDSTGAPLAGVEVLIGQTTFRTETNAQGRYIMAGLPAGVYQAIFRKVGHLPVRIDVRLAPGDTTRANTTLIESAVVLDPVIVTGAPESSRGVGVGREALEERRKMGFGRFFDSEQLRQYEDYLKLEDVLRRYSDVQILRDLSGFYAFNNVRRDINGKPNCMMQVYYNGSPVGKGGVVGTSDLNPTDLRMFGLFGLEAVEVYRSAAEIPQEYGGPGAGCGVILLWSRANP
ncbi:MAG: carboxypeptidase-like regulatory domain-containing protein [Gemmatimonadota bacterium]|nr:carboxypeptidase-like regulatory domain-containing protein [Gemmatimonadota bacterium]